MDKTLESRHNIAALRWAERDAVGDHGRSFLFDVSIENLS